MTILQETFQLENGVKIPKIGLGTWQSAPQDAYNATKFALENGYIHVDTAYVYGNEPEVGKAVREAAVNREDIFVTTKVPAEITTYEEAKVVIEKSLSQLDIDYIDLLLIHAPRPWSRIKQPNPAEDDLKNREVWRAMEEFYEAGQVKSIGVSNFSQREIETLLEHGKVQPMVNQIIYHIGNTDPELLAFCQEKNILVEGYSPIATGRLLKDEKVLAIAEKYGKSIPQISIRYLLEKGILPLPKSVHEEYILQNSQVDFELTKEDVAYLDSL